MIAGTKIAVDAPAASMLPVDDSDVQSEGGIESLWIREKRLKRRQSQPPEAALVGPPNDCRSLPLPSIEKFNPGGFKATAVEFVPRNLSSDAQYDEGIFCGDESVRISRGYRCPDLSCGVSPRLFKPGGFAAWSLSRLNNDDI